MKHLLTFIAVALFLVLVKLYLIAPPKQEVEIEIARDTITIERPVVRESITTRFITRHLPLVKQDTLLVMSVDTVVDSAVVQVPITTKVYQDSTYRAVISGYEASLDSISIYNKTIFYREKDKRWHIGLGAGAGFDGHKIRPFVGVTVSYSLFKF